MRHSLIHTYGASLVIAVAVLMAARAVPHAQRGRGGARAESALTSAIVDRPDAYYGKVVTISAGVEEILSKTTFTIDLRRVAEDGRGLTNVGKALLVIAPDLTGAIDLKNYLLMRGEVVKFDPAEIAAKAKGYKLDLAPEVVAKYQGRPALLAASVINSQYVELAKKPVRPMTANEVALSKVMKRIGPANTALQAAVKEPVAGVVGENAVALKQAFTEVEAIWTGIGLTPAAQWARAARGDADSIERNAAGGNWDAVKTSVGALGEKCATCHAAYRERQEDGTFRFKPGSF